MVVPNLAFVSSTQHVYCMDSSCVPVELLGPEERPVEPVLVVLVPSDPWVRCRFHVEICLGQTGCCEDALGLVNVELLSSVSMDSGSGCFETVIFPAVYGLATAETVTVRVDEPDVDVMRPLVEGGDLQCPCDQGYDREIANLRGSELAVLHVVPCSCCAIFLAAG